MESAADLPGAAHLTLVDGVAHLDPEPAAFEAMLDGWATQQRSRFLRATTIKPRVDLVRRFAAFPNEYPWQWEPSEVDAFFASLPIVASTARNQQATLRMFCAYVTDGRYGWPAKCRPPLISGRSAGTLTDPARCLVRQRLRRSATRAAASRRRPSCSRGGPCSGVRRLPVPPQ